MPNIKSDVTFDPESLRVVPNYYGAIDEDGNHYQAHRGFVIQSLADGCDLYEYQGVFPTRDEANLCLKHLFYSCKSYKPNFTYIGSSR